MLAVRSLLALLGCVLLGSSFMTYVHGRPDGSTLESVLASRLAGRLAGQTGSANTEQTCNVVASKIKDDPKIQEFKQCASSKPVNEKCCGLLVDYAQYDYCFAFSNFRTQADEFLKPATNFTEAQQICQGRSGGVSGLLCNGVARKAKDDPKMQEFKRCAATKPVDVTCCTSLADYARYRRCFNISDFMAQADQFLRPETTFEEARNACLGRSGGFVPTDGSMTGGPVAVDGAGGPIATDGTGA